MTRSQFHSISHHIDSATQLHSVNSCYHSFNSVNGIVLTIFNAHIVATNAGKGYGMIVTWVP